MLVECDSFELFLGLEDLLVCALLKTIEAEHEDDGGEQNSESHHKEHKSFIVEVVGGERSRDLSPVEHWQELYLRHAIAKLLEPARIVKNDENVVVDFVTRQERII